MQKETYQPPILTIHELLRDITAGVSRGVAGPRTGTIDRLLITQPRLPRL